MCNDAGYIYNYSHYYYLLDFVTWQEGKSDYAADELS